MELVCTSIRCRRCCFVVFFASTMMPQYVMLVARVQLLGPAVQLSLQQSTGIMSIGFSTDLRHCLSSCLFLKRKQNAQQTQIRFVSLCLVCFLLVCWIFLLFLLFSLLFWFFSILRIWQHHHQSSSTGNAANAGRKYAGRVSTFFLFGKSSRKKASQEKLLSHSYIFQLLRLWPVAGHCLGLYLGSSFFNFLLLL